MPISAWVTQWIQARDDELLYGVEDAALAPEAVLPTQFVLRARGVRVIQHAILLAPAWSDEATPVTMDGLGPMLCESVYPAPRCTCGQYRLVWER